MKIQPGDLNDERVLSLVRAHLAGMQDNSPPGSVYALDLSGITQPDVSIFTAWEREALLGIVALRELDSTTGEVKSMRTDANHLRKGVAAALLEHILNVARERRYQRLSLETGSGRCFDPAIELYRKYGFLNGTAFGAYTQSEFNQFMHLDL